MRDSAEVSDNPAVKASKKPINVDVSVRVLPADGLLRRSSVTDRLPALAHCLSCGCVRVNT